MASSFAIRYACHQIHHGGIIAYPTETVYGLGCDPLNAEAVNDLCSLKQRDINKGLILLSPSLQLLEDYIQPLDAEHQKKILHSQQPTSWIVPVLSNTPKWLTGEHNSLFIRITSHPVVTKLCHLLGHPLVSSSANTRGNKPALNALQLRRYFKNELDAILISEEKSSGQPSTIRRLDDETLIRN